MYKNKALLVLKESKVKMKESEIENKEIKEIEFPLGYKRPAKEDLFKFFIIENREIVKKI